MPVLFIIGGPNGSGKTSSAMTLLPDLLQCEEYINADAIAASLSPFHPESTAIQAGKLMLKRIRDLANQKRDFSFEITMASRSFIPFLKECKKQGYTINLIFLWLRNAKLAIDRVKLRVINGGHDIPSYVITRRYQRCIKNFLQLYAPLADNWFLYDNSARTPRLIAEQEEHQTFVLYDKTIWQIIEALNEKNK